MLASTIVGVIWSVMPANIAYAQMSTGQKTMANFVHVELGSFHALALDDEGRVYSWSYANEANTGINGSLRGRPNIGTDWNLATQIEYAWDGGQLVNMPWIKKISASESLNLALDQYGNIWSWGIHDRGEINVAHPLYSVTAAQAASAYGAGAGAFVAPGKVIMPVVEVNGEMVQIYAVDIAASSGGGRFIDQFGCLWAWGHGANALTGTGFALGTGVSESRNRPVQITTDSLGNALPGTPGNTDKFVSVVGCDYPGIVVWIALTANGDVYTIAPYNSASTGGTWNNAGHVQGRPMKVDISACLGKIVKVDCGNGMFGTMDEYGNIYTWGDNGGGSSSGLNYRPSAAKLGLGTGTGAATSNHRSDPTRVTQVSPTFFTGAGNAAQQAQLKASPQFKDFSMYQWGWIALDTDGKLYGIGCNPYDNYRSYSPSHNAATDPDTRYLMEFTPYVLRNSPDTKIMSISYGWLGAGFMDEHGNLYVNSNNANIQSRATAAEPWVHVK